MPPPAAVVQPGFGWAPGDNSSVCPAGSYNPGYNARKCTPCPGGLTTAGPGFYYLRGKAVACARGTFKTAIANQDCSECPVGMTTPDWTVAAVDRGVMCNVLLPGYALQARPTIGVTNATVCPPDTFRAGEVAGISFASGEIPCTPCGNGLVTLPNVTLATTPDACLAPPGYAYSAAMGTVAGMAALCPSNTYNSGYNRQPCISCGGGLLTDATGSTNPEACYTPAGWGSALSAETGAHIASVCPVDTYGRPTK